jgi:SPP1 gp7 family putative phage head morphogenesis protein
MCVKCGVINLSVKPDGLEPEVKRVAKLIYEGKLKPGQIDKAMVKKIADQLMNGVLKGYGKNLSSKSLTPEERSFLTKINTNVFVFSGFKNYQQLHETSMLLKTDDGVIKPFNDFLNDVLQVDKTYNEVYLSAEYDNAIASAQMAQSWQDMQSNGVEMLTYQTAGDDRVRDDHVILNGITLALDDPFWNTYYPPNDWGCRCDAIPSTETKEVSEPASSLPDLPPMFQNNVGKSGIIFPDTHPYFDVSRSIAEHILNQVDDIIPPDTGTNIYYKSSSGGTVETEAGLNKNELKGNAEIAKFLADLKHNIKLLAIDDTPGVKNADALINGEKFEFKTNKKPTKSAIDNELRKAKDQADHVLINIKSKIPAEDLSDAINDRARRSDSIKQVWLMYDNRLIKLSREQLKDRGLILKEIKKGNLPK